MAAPEPDPSASLHKLAMDLFDETMANLRFQQRHGPEWDALREQMPARLREIKEANRQAQWAECWARNELTAARDADRWYGDRGQRYVETLETAPDDAPAQREVLLREMGQRHARLLREAEAANQAEQDVQDEWRDAENDLAREWHEEHIPHLQAMIAAFKPEFERHRFRIAGFVDLKRLKLGNLAEGASTAFQVLLTFAERVVLFRANSCAGLDPDQLRVEVEKEIGWLARAVATSATSGNETPTLTLPHAGSTAERPSIRPKRVQKTIDDVGYDMLCTAWDDHDPEHRRLPTWPQLADAVHKQLELTTKVESTLTALKQRSPRTRAKRDEIAAEIEQERRLRNR